MINVSMMLEKNMQDAFSDYQVTPTSENQSKLQNEKEKLTQLFVAVKEGELKEIIRKVVESDSTYRHGQSWRLINEISGRKGAKRGLIKGNSKEDRRKLCYDHFNNLLGKRPEIPDEDEEDDILPGLEDLGINNKPFMISELLKAEKSQCDVKAVGPDDIQPDVIKRCDFNEIILTFANKLIVDGLKPVQWSENDLITLSKSGDLSDTGNYRGITLSCVVAKVIN